jgi:hypothetical protein
MPKLSPRTTQVRLSSDDDDDKESHTSPVQDGGHLEDEFYMQEDDHDEVLSVFYPTVSGAQYSDSCRAKKLLRERC